MDTAFETAQPASALDSNSLLAQIMEETQLQPGEESYDIALRGVEAFIADLLKSESTNEKINKAVVDRMIVEVDAKITGQVDAIIHHPSFQEMESVWRGLKILVDRTDFRENIKIDVLSVSKTDLLEDFELAPEVVQSGLYKHVYGR
jgi:type VI secretion system protein ImpC